MKKKQLTALSVIAVIIFTACANPFFPPKDESGKKTIIYNAIQTGGMAGAADTTGIVFTFNRAVNGLTADEIIITNGTGSVVKGTLTGSDTLWTLGIAVATAGDIMVGIDKKGIESKAKTVAVYKSDQIPGPDPDPDPAITYTVAQVGGIDAQVSTTGIAFTFSEPVSGLTADDIILTNGNGEAVKGTLDGSGTSWVLGITVTKPGTITVQIIKDGIEDEIKNVALIFHDTMPAPTITGITAVYTGTDAIYPSTLLDSLKADLIVKVQYSDGYESTLSWNEYALSGTLSVGTSYIVVTYTYEGKDGIESNITAFNVTVSPEIPIDDPEEPYPVTPDPDITYTVEQLGGVDADTATSAIKFTFDADIDSYNVSAADITVGAGNGSVIAGAFTGSGTTWELEITTVNTPGYITITIIKEGIESETKIVPLVYHPTIQAPTITGITAEPADENIPANTPIIVPVNTTLEQLKNYLIVTAHYSGGVDYILSNGDYDLSGGPLTGGTYTITADFEGKTDTISVKALITYTVEQVGGIDANTDSIGLMFVFSAGVDSYGLTADDIDILSASTASLDMGALTRISGTEWFWVIDDVQLPGFIVLQIPHKDGIDDEPHHVAIVYDNIIKAPTITVDAVYAQRGVLYPDTPFDNLKNTLMVKLLYDGQSPQMMSRSEYSLSGTLIVPTSTMTVNAQGFISTFTVTIASRYTAVQTGGAADTTNSDGILLTFEANIDGVGLTAADITVTNGTGSVTKGSSLTKISDTVWKLGITDVATAGNVSVVINKKIGALPVIEAAAKSVAVYKGVTSVATPFTIAFEQFTGTDISEPLLDVSTPHIAIITLAGTYDAGSITWYYNGSSIGTPGSDTLTINTATDDHFKKMGTYYITVEAKKNGILYSKRIKLTISAP